jgi:hypothetical protein
MKRIGPNGEGYDKLQSEFNDNIERITLHLKEFAADLAGEVQQQFTQKYFQMNHISMSHLLNLLSDLTWVKNWQIENRESDILYPRDAPKA